MNLEPKLENVGKGFHYTISDEEIERYKQFTIEEKFQWIEDMNALLNAVQTDDEKRMMRIIKHKRTTLDLKDEII